MNDINIQIIEGVVSSPTLVPENNREELSHLMRNHHRSFGGATSIDDMSHMTVEQQLMLLYYWVADGYRNGDLTSEQVELLKNPTAVIRKRLLKEEKDSLTHRLWHGALRTSEKSLPDDRSESIRAVEEALEEYDEAVVDDYSERVPIEGE